MKKITIVFFAAITLLSGGLKAQTDLRMSELSPYIDAYMKPFAGAMAVGMSGGWVTTAKTHSTFGFDVTLSASLVNVPKADYTFDAEALNMPGFSFSDALGGDINNAPTISASNDLESIRMGKFVEVEDVGSGTIFFPGFKGLGINKGGGAALQVGFGLPKGTEIMARYVPNFSNSINNMIGDDFSLSKTGMWGVGVKHDIKQWIPVVKSVPFLQISALFNYSSFKSGFGGSSFRFDPETLSASSDLPESTWDDQRFDFGMSSFSGTLLVGASIPVFQPYIGIGFNSAKFDGTFVGQYPVTTLDATGGFTVDEYEVDPINVNFNETLFNFQAGARLKLGLFILHYTYSIQTYSMHTAGLGFTFR